MIKFTIHTIRGAFEFNGKHESKSQVTDWLFFETDDGRNFTFKKEHIVCIFESKIKSKD